MFLRITIAVIAMLNHRPNLWIKRDRLIGSQGNSPIAVTRGLVQSYESVQGGQASLPLSVPSKPAIQPLMGGLRASSRLFLWSPPESGSIFPEAFIFISK